MFVFPVITKSISYAVFYTSASSAYIDITDEKCNLTISSSDVTGTCTMTVFNYGKLDHIKVIPDLTLVIDFSDRVKFDPQLIILDSHTTTRVTFHVTGTSTELSSAFVNSTVNILILDEIGIDS